MESGLYLTDEKIEEEEEANGFWKKCVDGVRFVDFVKMQKESGKRNTGKMGYLRRENPDYVDKDIFFNVRNLAVL